MDPNRLTEKAQEAVRQAQSLAQRHGQSQIEVEHVALALLGQDGGVAARVLAKAGVSPATGSCVPSSRAASIWRGTFRRAPAVSDNSATTSSSCRRGRPTAAS